MCYFKFHGNLVIIQKLAENYFSEKCVYDLLNWKQNWAKSIAHVLSMRIVPKFAIRE
jgi:hypothetical protein